MVFLGVVAFLAAASFTGLLGVLPPVDFLAVILAFFELSGVVGEEGLDFWNLISSSVEWVRKPELRESSEEASSSPLAGGACFPRGILGDRRLAWQDPASPGLSR